MSVHVIYYKDGAKMMRPVLTREEYLALRDSEANRKADKKHLVQMNYSCTQTPRPPLGGGINPAQSTLAQLTSAEEMLPLKGDGGSTQSEMLPLKGCTTPSNSVGMDVDFTFDANATEVDKAKKFQEIMDTILMKKEELGLLMLERSFSKGFHIVFRRHPEMTQEQNLRWASQLLGVEYDKGAKDITRVFFTPPSEKMIYLDDEIFQTLPLPSRTPSIPRTAGAEIRVGREHDESVGKKEGGAPSVVTNSPHYGGDVAERQRGSSEVGLYNGIPYSLIVKKWWEMYNDGQEPCPGNRNTLTFELAVNLRHICGFDRELLNKVIPDYWSWDGGSSEKLACIDSALSERRTQMPRRLREVLIAVQQDMLKAGGDQNVLALTGEGWEEGLGDLYHYDQLPKMPQGVKESIDAAGHPLAMTTMIAIAPAIGTLATGVKLDVHGTAKGLNLCSFVVGDAASGKGQMDDIVAAWMKELQEETDLYNLQEEEWAQKTRRIKTGKTPEQPKLPARMLPLNNTVPNLAARLANTDGKHSFSYTPEADNVARTWKQSVSDFSTMLRQAYDESRYDREAKSVDAVRVHIEHLRWNVTMCGTQDALYRVISNYTDGLLSRIAIARTPDNTYAPLADNPAHLTDVQAERIQQIAHLLPLMTGTVVLPKLEERGRQWLETIRLEAMKNDDRVLARQRMRGCVSAQRITCALWLPKVAELLIKKHGMNGAETQLKRNPELWIEMLRRQQTEEMLQLFDLVADYLIDNDMYFFRSRIEAAYESQNYQGSSFAIRNRRGKNDSIYERLADEFSFEQLYQQTLAVKGMAATRNSVHQMLKNWRNQGLITTLPDGRCRKNKV